MYQPLDDEGLIDCISAYPNLPEDLQREIFEIVALSSLHDATTLTRVAKHVYIWIQTVLCRVVVTSHQNHSLEWYQKNGKHVKHLLTNTNEQLLNILLCPNIQDLAAWVSRFSPQVRETISTLPLRRLSVNLAHLFGSPMAFQNYVKGPHSAAGAPFSQLTHLEVVDSCKSWAEWDGFAMLPRLTHLSFYSCVKDTDVVEGALEHCKGLKILALVRAIHNAGTAEARKAGKGNAVRHLLYHVDPRVVSFGCKFSEDWEAGARGKWDMWAMAEEVVAERLAKIKNRVGVWDELQIDAEDCVPDFGSKLFIDDSSLM